MRSYLFLNFRFQPNAMKILHLRRCVFLTSENTYVGEYSKSVIKPFTSIVKKIKDKDGTPEK